MSRPRQRRGVTYSCVHLEFYPIIIFYEIVREIEPLLGIVQMFTHVGNLIKLYGAACLLYQFLVSYYLLLIHCEAQGKGRAKGRPRKVTKRSFIDMDGGWWLSFP